MTKAARLRAQMLQEIVRMSEFNEIEFRDSAIGRQAYLKGSHLAVWEVILIAQNYGTDIDRLTTYFQQPHEWVIAAFDYYEAYSDEIDPILAENRSKDREKLKRLLPGLEKMALPDEVLDEAML